MEAWQTPWFMRSGIDGSRGGSPSARQNGLVNLILDEAEIGHGAIDRLSPIVHTRPSMIDLRHARVGINLHRPLAASRGDCGDRPAVGRTVWDTPNAGPWTAAGRKDPAPGSWWGVSSAASIGTAGGDT